MMQTNKGKELILNRLYKSSPDYTHISDAEIGSSSIPSDPTDETLGNSLGAYSFLAGYPIADTANRLVRTRVLLDENTLNGETINEGGLFNSTDYMYERTVCQAINKTSSYQVSFVWTWRVL